MGLSFFPRTDAGQFVINVKAPTGTRLELTESYVKRVENIVRQIVPADELNAIVSNIGRERRSIGSFHAKFRDAHRLRASWPERGASSVSSFAYMDDSPQAE